MRRIPREFQDLKEIRPCMGRIDPESQEQLELRDRIILDGDLASIPLLDLDGMGNARTIKGIDEVNGEERKRVTDGLDEEMRGLEVEETPLFQGKILEDFKDVRIEVEITRETLLEIFIAREEMQDGISDANVKIPHEQGREIT